VSEAQRRGQGRLAPPCTAYTSAPPLAPPLAPVQVWDYAGDNYVHRLIQNKVGTHRHARHSLRPHASSLRPHAFQVDGKLVELPDPGRRGEGSSLGAEHDGMGGMGGMGGTAQLDGAAVEMKQRGLEQAYEAVEHEYSMLLAGQLEAQRAHYEEAQAVGLAELRSSLEGRLATAEAVEARGAQKEGLLREMTRRLAERERRLLSLEEERSPGPLPYYPPCCATSPCRATPHLPRYTPFAVPPPLAALHPLTTL